MRFGICAQVDQIDAIRDCGYAYIELPLAQTAALSPSDFVALSKEIKRAGLPVEAFNLFFPRQMRLTGPDADLPAAWAYARSAFERAALLGAQVVVFGSGGARTVPEGFPMQRAWQQLVDLLHGLDPIAAEFGITVAIEPLNRSESNIITSVADAMRLAADVDRPHIQVLADSYHMLREHEDPSVLLRVRDRLVHVHTARSESRLYPTIADEQLQAFFAALKQARYSGRVSIEARSDDLRTDARRSFDVLRRLVAS